jgi:hypothetical protein
MNPDSGPALSTEIPRATFFNGLITCPHCGGWIEPGANEPGQIVACPHCSGHFHLPETVDLGFVPPRAHFGAPLPREPWFYGFIDNYARVWMWLAMLLTTLGALAATVMALSVQIPALPPDGQYWIKGIVFVAAIILSVSGLIGVLLSVAFMRLAVDIGRNLRAIRHRHHEDRI